MLSFVFSILLLCVSAAYAGDLFSIKADKLSYVPNAPALFLIEVGSAPTNGNFEIAFETHMDGNQLETVKVNDNLYLVRVDDIGGEGSRDISVGYHLRDKILDQNYSDAISTLELEILELIRARARSDEDEISIINAKISKLEFQIKQFLLKKGALLRLVESQRLLVEVESSKLQKAAFLFLSADRDNPRYNPGEKVTLFGHVYADVQDKDAFIEAYWGQNKLEVEELLNNEFIIKSRVLVSSDLGDRYFSVKLFLRDALRSSRLEDAKTVLQQRIADVNAEIAVEVNPLRLQQLNELKADLSKLLQHVNLLLVSMSELLETQSFRFKVVNP
jgi:hypothetical protein